MNDVNGCGPMTGIFRFIKPPHYEFFHDECIKHDIKYNIGGDESDRLRADRDLFNGMVKHSIEYFTDYKIGSLVWFIILSYIYYLCIRGFGKKHFNLK